MVASQLLISEGKLEKLRKATAKKTKASAIERAYTERTAKEKKRGSKRHSALLDILGWNYPYVWTDV